MKQACTLTLFLSLLSLIACSQFQPAQPLTGYGGSTYAYDSVIMINNDDGPTGFMLYIPASPHADSLPLVIFNHGDGAWNPMGYGAWINHIVRRGSIVIFPMYQKSPLESPSLFTPNADTGVLRALDTLQAHNEYTQPILSKLCIVGHSAGGVITANLGEYYGAYGLPKPAAIMGAAPGKGTGSGALPTYSNMDSSIFILSIFEQDDEIVDSAFALTLFDSTVAVPYSHKNLVIHHPDSTGTPPCGSDHGQACSVDSAYNNGDAGVVISLANLSATDAVDYFCYWKLFDALQDCALNGNGCSTAFGDTYEQKYAGTWSNGTPIIPMSVRPAAIPTGITEAVNMGIRIFPNPASNLLTIDPGSKNAGTVSICNMEGQELMVKSFQGGNAYSVDVSSLPAGIYSVSFLVRGRKIWDDELVIKR